MCTSRIVARVEKQKSPKVQSAHSGIVSKSQAFERAMCQSCARYSKVIGVG